MIPGAQGRLVTSRRVSPTSEGKPAVQLSQAALYERSGRRDTTFSARTPDPARRCEAAGGPGPPLSVPGPDAQARAGRGTRS